MGNCQHAQFLHDYDILNMSKILENHGKHERADTFNKTVPGVDLGDGGRRALVSEGRQNRFATLGKRSLPRIGFCCISLKI